MKKDEWIAVDFDGTLVEERPWPEIGPAVQLMVDRVKGWIANGHEVRIFTARVSDLYLNGHEEHARIEQWAKDTFGYKLLITCEKDQKCGIIYDNIAHHVITNTGKIAGFDGKFDAGVHENFPKMPEENDDSWAATNASRQEAARKFLIIDEVDHDQGDPELLTVPEILRRAAELFEERNALYGDNYKQFGTVMMALFPEGLQITTSGEWNRIGILVQLVNKLGRYCANAHVGGHKDSSRDKVVYAAMLDELTPNESNDTTPTPS